MARRGKDHSKRTHKKRATHTEKLGFLSQFKKVADPTNKRSVSRQYKQLVRFAHLHRAADKATVRELKRRGFFTTDKGVIIDGPRDAKRHPIRGAKMRINRDGVIVWSVASRRDYIVGLLPHERKQFALDPDKFIDKKKDELRETYPVLRGIPKSKIQARLQWGAYQAQKDFHISTLTRVYQLPWEKAFNKVKDRLVGIHFVVHIRK